eukprot:TRINITY_DN4346_c0_g2_i2.p1 TRINITY_DN4346_c0_g2~~TRINITY_DN4346_c0_g2_i2.p1  ORF type:complete len:504 (+),score=106.54 TRINITY_DN4346_c0_g2_i2:171-1682(+)
MRIGQLSYSYKEKSKIWEDDKVSKIIIQPLEKKAIYETLKRDLEIDVESEEMKERMNESKKILKQISFDYYKEIKRYTGEFIDYHLSIVPDINPFRNPMQRYYYEIALGIENREINEFYNLSITDFKYQYMWAPFRLVRKLSGKYWDKYVPPIFQMTPNFEIGMWRLENQMHREFSAYFIRVANYLFLSRKDLEKRKKAREETNLWPTRVISEILLALAPPKVKELHAWYKFLIEPGLFNLLRRWVDVEPRPRKSILGEAIGQPPPQRLAIFSTKFYGTMGTLYKVNETSRKTWASIFGDLFTCIPASLLLYPFSLRFKYEMIGITFKQAFEMGLVWNSLPTYMLRFVASRAATLAILKFVPLRKVEKGLFNYNKKFSSRKNNENKKKSQRKQYHKLVFGTVLAHWLSRIVDIFAKALVYPLHTIENRTATSYTFDNEKAKRKYDGGYECYEDIYENEGSSGFYKGFWNLAILGVIETVWSWCVLYPVATATVNTFTKSDEED